MRTTLRSNSTALMSLRRDVNGWRTRQDAEKMTVQEQGKRLLELGKGLAEVQKQVTTQEVQLSELTRRADGQDQKILELMQEVATLKERLPAPSAAEASNAMEEKFTTVKSSAEKSTSEKSAGNSCTNDDEDSSEKDITKHCIEAVDNTEESKQLSDKAGEKSETAGQMSKEERTSRKRKMLPQCVDRPISPVLSKKPKTS